MINDQIKLEDFGGDEVVFSVWFWSMWEREELENLAVGVGVSQALGTSMCSAKVLVVLGLLLDVFSLCSIRSAQNVLVQMMAMRSRRIPCLLSATKGNTDSPQTARREGLEQRIH